MNAQAYALPETVVFKWDDWPPEEEGSIMQFRLLYRGLLKSAGNKNKRSKEKHEVRRFLHPQLKELWNAHPLLGEEIQDQKQMEKYYLDREGYRFLPLIGHRPRRVVGCRLKILFLRRGLPGDLVGAGQGRQGDIDNRIKTFLDGLKVPQGKDDLPPPYEKPGEGEDPFFCLMLDDNLITEINVTSDRLLLPRGKCPCEDCACDARDTTNENYVEIVMDVDSFVMDDGPYPVARWG